MPRPARIKCFTTSKQPTQQLAPGCEIACRAKNHRVKEEFYLHLPSALYTQKILIHANNKVNQTVAIANRVLGRVPEPTEYGRRMIDYGSAAITAALKPCTAWDLSRFYSDYPSAKKARYERAHKAIISSEYRSQFARITAFVKRERMDATAKVDPDPRVIQFRDPRYCVLLASSLKPLEHQLYNLKMNHPNLVGCTRLVGKGLNQFERATLLAKKMRQFANPVVLSLDMSRFDKHVSPYQLRAEHRIYLARCIGNPLLERLLEDQVRNRGSTSSGIKYTTYGKRMSGDMNTALGNCIIMIGMMLAVFAECNIIGDLFDDGDDCLVIIEEGDLPVFKQRVTALCLEMGHELKIESEARSLEKVTWCQSNPVQTTSGWKFVRNPYKVMNCALVGTKWVHMPTHLRYRYLKGLGKCESVLNRGVPVLSAFADALLRNAGDADPLYDESAGTWIRVQREARHGGTDTTISWDARRTFAEAFGIPVHIQQLWEEALGNWEITLDGDECQPPPVFNDWTYNQAWGNGFPLG